nr:MAG TPA: hypothetical protein [Caudoviricetes sp.]
MQAKRSERSSDNEKSELSMSLHSPRHPQAFLRKVLTQKAGY